MGYKLSKSFKIAVQAQYRCVTDRQTSRQLDSHVSTAKTALTHCVARVDRVEEPQHQHRECAISMEGSYLEPAVTVRQEAKKYVNGANLDHLNFTNLEQWTCNLRLRVRIRYGKLGLMTLKAFII